MSTLMFIRKVVFGGITQDAFAKIAGVSQTTVTRWENETSHPDLKQMRSIRDEALSRGLDWSDTWFFQAPAEADVCEQNGTTVAV